MANISFKNLCKTYPNGVPAVKNFTIDIKDGEFVVLLGPSGCGKSTTLMMLAGLEEITAGELYIGDTLVNNCTPKERDIAMVFQSYALLPNMNVYENIGFGLTIRKMNKAEKDRRIREAAKMLGLEDYLDRKPRHLSGGQKQRVAIGRCIVREPKAFLFDEPLSNLDAKLRVQMRKELIRLHQMLKTTIVYVTHDQTEAMTMGDRIVVMRDGEVQQIGVPQEVYDRPANLFTATFIGSPKMNIFEAELSFKGEEASVRLPNGVELSVKQEDARSLKKVKGTGGKILLGVRPDRVRPVPARTPASLCGKVTLVDVLGEEKNIYFTFEGQQFIARDDSGETYARGEQEFVLDLEGASFFDIETEKALL